MAENSIPENGPIVNRPDANRIFEDWENSDFAKRLRLVFDNLHDEKLLEALEATRWTGRPGYPIRVMWRTYIASYVLNVGTFTGLIRELHANPFLAYLCGITSREAIPSKYAYCRFLKKLVAHKELVLECMASLAGELGRALPGFGEIVAVDSTDIHAYSNGAKKPSSDPDASWSAKKGRNGQPRFWFGYKGHLMVDAEHEIPIWMHTTTAKRNDGREILPLLRDARDWLPGFHPQYVLADAGYDHKRVYEGIVEDFGAKPIIKMNPHGKDLKEIWDELTTYEGTPYAPCGEPMKFWGYEKKRGTLKYRCQKSKREDGPSCWYYGCRSGHAYTLRLKIADDYRRYCQVPRSTKRWARLYNMRASVERAFSRLKEFRKLDNLHVRGLPKIELHCLLAVLVMQSMALGMAKANGIQNARNNVKKVA